jgi:hypothetical protein
MALVRRDSLVPVIGLVQVGAGHGGPVYLYSLIRIFIMIAWVPPIYSPAGEGGIVVLGVAGGAALALLSATACIQTAELEKQRYAVQARPEATSSNALAFNREPPLPRMMEKDAISITRRRYGSIRHISMQLQSRERTGTIGEVKEAIAMYHQVLRLRPGMIEAHNNRDCPCEVEDWMKRSYISIGSPGGSGMRTRRNLGIALQNRK